MSLTTYLLMLYIIGVVASNRVKHGANPLKCGLNEKAVKRRTICPPQNCEISYTEYDCSKVKNVCEPGCDCLPNYLRNGSGICILNDDCPYPSFPICGINEIARDCRKTCPPQTCESRLALYKCPGEPLCEPGCDCVLNYLRDSDGVCIPADKCDSTNPIKCGINEKAVKRRTICPPQNCEISYTEYDCSKVKNVCEPGCDCLPNYLRNGSGICILNDDCPYPSFPICGINEIARDCRITCPPQTCESRLAFYKCPGEPPCEPGCDCVPNYLRDSDGVCIRADKCDSTNPIKCGINEKAVKRRTICPPQNCEISYTEYDCSKVKNVCEPGCDCLPNYLRNGSGICILNDDCPYPSFPICGINEIARDCRITCPPQTCESRLAFYKCPGEPPCEPGCDCVPNYLRDSDGVCIPADKCDSIPPKTCSIPKKCIRTCASPNPPNCPYTPAKSNIDGCECKEGYILSEVGGTCIKIEDCPSEVSCNGDPNARAKQCPLPCPSTCDRPNAANCLVACQPLGCECEPGYLYSKIGGKCILPDKCPGGNPCGENEEFRTCNYDYCPENYCPEDENSYSIVCDPFPLCLSGCSCKLNYRRLSQEDKRCIVASDCPPVNCTRPNEVWDGCPSACLAERCEDRYNKSTTCQTLVLNCQPRCVCKCKFYRNTENVCVSSCDC